MDDKDEEGLGPGCVGFFLLEWPFAVFFLWKNWGHFGDLTLGDYLAMKIGMLVGALALYQVIRALNFVCKFVSNPKRKMKMADEIKMFDDYYVFVPGYGFVKSADEEQIEYVDDLSSCLLFDTFEEALTWCREHWSCLKIKYPMYSILRGCRDYFGEPQD